MALFCGIWNHADKLGGGLLPLLDSMASFEVGGAENNLFLEKNLALAWDNEDFSFAEGMLFAGSIYNMAQLCKLVGCQEENKARLLCKLFHKIGVAEGLRRINGIFSLAYFHENHLYLAKDHFGVAPLYYGRVGDDYIFSNQLSALSRFPRFRKKVNIEALSAFIKFNWVAGNLCIYEGIHKIPPGHYVQIQRYEPPKLHKYFDPVQIALKTQAMPKSSSDKELLAEFQCLLDQAIDCRLNGSGRQGLLLSGGMDSSLLAAFLSAKGQLNTFTIGFQEAAFNEAEYARLVADKVGANFHQAILDGPQAASLLPELVEVYEEPFADQSQIPTLAAMKLASAIEEPLWLGDGGDELFMGYPRHLAHARYALPHDPATGKVKPLTYLLHPWRSFLYFGLRQPMNYIDRHRTNPEYHKLLRNYQEPDLGLAEYNHIYKIKDPSKQADLFDILTYLPGNGVIKASRLAARLGITINCPLLDYNLFCFAQKLPRHLLASQGQGKQIMRQTLYQYFPREWIDRPKSGFGAPVGQWLQNEFLSWRNELLDEKSVREQGFFNFDQIKIYLQQLGKRGSATNKLWAILMFQVWARREGLI